MAGAADIPVRSIGIGKRAMVVERPGPHIEAELTRVRVQARVPTNVCFSALAVAKQSFRFRPGAAIGFLIPSSSIEGPASPKRDAGYGSPNPNQGPDTWIAILEGGTRCSKGRASRGFAAARVRAPYCTLLS